MGACGSYLAAIRFDSTLYGSSVYEEGLVDQWLDIAQLSVEVPVAIISGAVSGATPEVSGRHCRWQMPSMAHQRC